MKLLELGRIARLELATSQLDGYFNFRFIPRRPIPLVADYPHRGSFPHRHLDKIRLGCLPMVCATGALEAPCLPVVATPTTAGRALVFPSRQT